MATEEGEAVVTAVATAVEEVVVEEMGEVGEIELWRALFDDITNFALCRRAGSELFDRVYPGAIGVFCYAFAPQYGFINLLKYFRI